MSIEEELSNQEKLNRVLEQEKEITQLSSRLGISLNSLLERLTNKKLQLTEVTQFLEEYDKKISELDELESEILKLLKKKLNSM